jgi:hypothetical protein
MRAEAHGLDLTHYWISDDAHEPEGGRSGPTVAMEDVFEGADLPKHGLWAVMGRVAEASSNNSVSVNMTCGW